MIVPPLSTKAASEERNERQRQHKSHKERRTEIVAATLTIIAEEGLHAWTTSALARRVGVSEATLFRHFASKDEILSAALSQLAEALRCRVAEFQGNGEGAWQELFGLVIDVLSFLEESGGAGLIILSGQARRISEDSRQAAEETRNLLRWRLTQLFRHAGCGGDHLRRPELLADMAIAVIHSTGLRWLMSGGEYPMQCQAAAMLTVLRQCVEK